MARYLKIFFGFTPNIQGNTYYCYQTKSAYLNFLNQKTNFIRVDLDNYRINTGVIKIRKDILEPLIYQIYEASYIVEIEERAPAFINTNILRCWHVKSFEELDYYLLHVEVDLWGTYFNTGLLSNINVLRCNRQLSYNGIYDEVENTGDGYAMRYEAPIYTNWLDRLPNTNIYSLAKESEIYIVYLIQYNIEQQVFGDDHISATALYATPLDEIRTAVNNSDYSTIKGATNIIGGIYGVTGKFGGTLDAQVIEAWILPTWFINIGNKSAGGSGDTLYHNFKSKSEHGDLTIKGYVVYPSKNLLEYRTIESDPNKVVYFGTINNGLKLKRYTYDNLHCFVYAYVGASTIQIIATQGEDQKDLTKDFTIMLTENSGVTTGIRAVAKALSRSISMGTSAYKDFAKGDYSSGGLGIVKGIADMVPLQPKIDKALGNGDASTIYYRRQSQASGDPKYNCVDNPFVATIFTSVIDEKARARLYGASFNELISNFSTIYTKDLLGTGTLEDTYIVANVRVDGVPTEAKTYIENTFKNGFYSQYLN